MEIVFFLGAGGDGGRCASADRALPGGRSRRGPARGRRALGRHARHGAGENAGPLDGHHAESLAALPDARLPRVGALGVLPGERRLRFPRPAPGRHGARAVAPGDDARASPARRRPAVRRRRRPALVAAAVRPGRAHAHFRRPGLARLRRRALCRDDRRHRGARRARAVPRRPGARGPASTMPISSPCVADETRIALRALRARRSTAASPSARTACR